MRTLRTLSILAVLAAVVAAASAQAADYVGAETCRDCHPKAWQAWKQTLHARASQALSPKQMKDGRCVLCHSPEQAKGRSDIGCESCHGGGQYYAPSYVMKDSELAHAVGLVDPTEKTCLRCHDASSPSLKPFDFKERLKLIDHWSAERAARGKTRK